MTREEAHKILSNGLVNAPSEHEWCMAFEMAIKALEQAPCEDAISRESAIDAVSEALEHVVIEHEDVAKKMINKLPPVKPQELCEDTISRILKIMWNCRGKNTTSIDKVKMEQIIRDELQSKREPCEDAISRQPEIIRCGQCKYAEVADSEDSQDGYTCQFHRGSIWFSGSYCSWAEPYKESEE